MPDTSHAAYQQTAVHPLGDLTQYPGNARRGDPDLILESLRRNGQYRSLIVRDEGTGRLTILAGNHTAQALQRHGPGPCDYRTHPSAQERPCGVCGNKPWKPSARVEVIVCDDDTARRINLIDNRAADIGDYDNDALTELLSYLDGDYDGTGYTDADVERLITPPGDLEAAFGDPNTAPLPPPTPVSAPGDLWILGPHRVLCGDATDMAAVEAMMVGDRADCMWTDPPYGVDYVGKTKDALTIQNDGAGGLPELLAGAFAVATAALKPGAPFYAGWSLRQQLVWVKSSFALGHNDYHYRHEPVWMGYTEGGAGRRGRGGDAWYGDNSQDSVFEVDKPARNGDHPTMKPIELIVAMLSNSCPPDGLVYEPFGGSGSTLIAAHQIGRVARVVELDPRYVDVICRRYQEYTGTVPVLATTGKAHNFTTDDANT